MKEMYRNEEEREKCRKFINIFNYNPLDTQGISRELKYMEFHLPNFRMDDTISLETQT